jgi:hypothetical protein
MCEFNWLLLEQQSKTWFVFLSVLGKLTPIHPPYRAQFEALELGHAKRGECVDGHREFQSSVLSTFKEMVW